MKFELIIKAFGLPDPIKEHRFHADRKWRFDFCWPDKMVAVEQEGGVFAVSYYKDNKTGGVRKHIGGRHNTGKGFVEDLNKYNTATSMGWRVLRFTPQQMSKTETIELIKKTLSL